MHNNNVVCYFELIGSKNLKYFSAVYDIHRLA